MIGPHEERIAQVDYQLTAGKMLQKIQARTDNPLNRVLEKLKREFAEYETAYSD